VYSCPRKSGKTTFEAIIELTMTPLYGGAFPESYILANSLEQGRGRVGFFKDTCLIELPAAHRSLRGLGGVGSLRRLFAWPPAVGCDFADLDRRRCFDPPSPNGNRGRNFRQR
jgi:hypothetical protein